MKQLSVGEVIIHKVWKDRYVITRIYKPDSQAKPRFYLLAPSGRCFETNLIDNFEPTGRYLPQLEELLWAIEHEEQ